MEKDGIILGFLLFFVAETIKILIVYYLPGLMKVKIDQAGSEDYHPRRVRMPAYWEMSHADLLKLAGKQGVMSKVKLKKDLIAELVELSR